MAQRPEIMARTLRDYPISLRESARAVFGSVYESAERQAAHAGGQERKTADALLPRS